MLEMIYGFIEEATATTKDWKLAARIGGPDGKIVYFGSKENKNAAIAAGSHVDVDKKLNAKAEQPKNEPVAGADLFKGDYEKERGGTIDDNGNSAKEIIKGIKNIGYSSMVTLYRKNRNGKLVQKKI
jgi:hypothetical protein